MTWEEYQTEIRELFYEFPGLLLVMAEKIQGVYDEVPMETPYVEGPEGTIRRIDWQRVVG